PPPGELRNSCSGSFILVPSYALRLFRPSLLGVCSVVYCCFPHPIFSGCELFPRGAEKSAQSQHLTIRSSRHRFAASAKPRKIVALPPPQSGAGLTQALDAREHPHDLGKIKST